MRKDKQLFRELDVIQLHFVIKGLDLLIDYHLERNQSVIDVRPIYMLARKAQKEWDLKIEKNNEELAEQRKVIRAASEELINESIA